MLPVLIILPSGHLQISKRCEGLARKLVIWSARLPHAPRARTQIFPH
jgi:hypothetical protein